METIFRRRQNFDQITATSGIQITQGIHHHQLPNRPSEKISMVKAEAEPADVKVATAEKPIAHQGRERPAIK